MQRGLMETKDKCWVWRSDKISYAKGAFRKIHQMLVPSHSMFRLDKCHLVHDFSVLWTWVGFIGVTCNMIFLWFNLAFTRNMPSIGFYGILFVQMPQKNCFLFMVWQKLQNKISVDAITSLTKHNCKVQNRIWMDEYFHHQCLGNLLRDANF